MKFWCSSQKMEFCCNLKISKIAHSHIMEADAEISKKGNLWRKSKQLRVTWCSKWATRKHGIFSRGDYQATRWSKNQNSRPWFGRKAPKGKINSLKKKWKKSRQWLISWWQRPKLLQRNHQKQPKKEYIEFVSDSMLNEEWRKRILLKPPGESQKTPGCNIYWYPGPSENGAAKKTNQNCGACWYQRYHQQHQLSEKCEADVKNGKWRVTLTKISFSGLVAQYDIERGDQLVADVNKRLKNFCLQNKLDFINRENILIKKVWRRWSTIF